MSTLLILFLLFIFLCCFRLRITFRWSTTPSSPASPSHLERGVESLSGDGNGVGFRDPFVKEGKREGEKLQDVLKGIYTKSGESWEEDERGEMMLKGGSERLGKGVGVWRVE